MASIISNLGVTYTFLKMSGMIEMAGYKVEEISPPGIYESAFRTINFRAPITDITTETLVYSSETPQVIISSYSSLMGGYHTFVDDNGIYRYNILVHQVKPELLKKVGVTSSSSTVSHILYCSWKVQDISTYYS